MSKKISIISKILLAITFFGAIAFTVLRTNLLFNFYDAANGFYTNDTLHFVFAYPLAALVILCAVAAYIYIKEGNCQKLPCSSLFFKGAALLSGCTLGGAAVYVFAKAVIPALKGIDIFDIALLIFSLIAMLYFFTFGKKADFRSLLCISNGIVALIIIFDLYFDRMVSYANHSVMLCFATCVFLALAFTAEANFALGRSVYKRYLAYAPSAVILSFALGAPDIIFALSGKASVLGDIYFDIIVIVFGIYHLARLTDIAFYKEEK